MYIQPHIDFCNIVWETRASLVNWQFCACKIILDYNVDDFHEAMKSLNILSFCDRLFLRKAKFMFKVRGRVNKKTA